MRDDCGKCIECLDMRKFGGPGRKKKACRYKKCIGKLSTSEYTYDGKKKLSSEEILQVKASLFIHLHHFSFINRG